MATLLLPSHCSVIAYTDGYALCLQSVIEKGVTVLGNREFTSKYLPRLS